MTATVTPETVAAEIIGHPVESLKFVSRHTKYPSCTHRGSEPETDEPTRWELEVLRVEHEMAGGDDHAGGGNVGGGSREILLVVTDAEGDEHEFADGSAEFARVERALPNGTPCKLTLADLSAPSWDGNNHTSPDVSTLAAMCGLAGTAYGHWEAGDYLDPSTITANDTAETLVSDARGQGVHLDTDDVERWLEEHRPEGQGE